MSDFINSTSEAIGSAGGLFISAKLGASPTGTTATTSTTTTTTGTTTGTTANTGTAAANPGTTATTTTAPMRWLDDRNPMLKRFLQVGRLAQFMASLAGLIFVGQSLLTATITC
jgi:hypothetical protein